MTAPSPPEIAGITFGWGAIFGLLNLLLGGGVVATWIKNRPKMREIEKQADEKLRDDLIARVAALEAARTVQDARFETERAQHMATMAVMRHRLNNMTMCLDALLLLIEQDPTKAAGAVVKIREMRAEQIRAEATERAAVHVAAITATASTP